MDLHGPCKGGVRGDGKVERLAAEVVHDVHLLDFILELHAAAHTGNHRALFRDAGDPLDVPAIGQQAAFSGIVVIHVGGRAADEETAHGHKEITQARNGAEALLHELGHQVNAVVEDHGRPLVFRLLENLENLRLLAAHTKVLQDP